jgi:peptidoglycan/xylan/chitin deacetylase (PgdA/CDA1 family)
MKKKTAVKRVIESIYFKCGFITRLLYTGIGLIVVLHRVCPAKSGQRLKANAGMEITPEHLEEIIAFFARRRYEFISLDRVAERLAAGKRGKKFVAFTFDDGYLDNLTHALPVFKQYNIPFTIYITTSFPDRKAVLWWYLLEDLVLARDSLTIETGGRAYTFDCRDSGEKEDTFYRIRSLIMDCSPNEYRERIAEIFAPFDIDLYGKTEDLALDWEQVEQLGREPLVTIGAHTVNHYALSKLPPEEVRKEIMVSRQTIESRTGLTVNHFAYPFGGREEAGEREFEIVRECGFDTAVTTRFAGIFPGHREHMESLPRIFIDPGCRRQCLTRIVNGSLPALSNKFKRLVT